jgi:phosphatidylcholine synthase
VQVIRVVAAAAVHVFTASGIVLALLALLDVLAGRYEWAFGWLFLALMVDAVDGAFARAVGVIEVLPRFSGERLDLVIDYVTYVFVPIVALLVGGFLVGTVGTIVAAVALLSALYHFSDLESKAQDNCFVGFPAVWNIVAFCVFALGIKGSWVLAVVLGLAVLTFVPMHWIHPMRVGRLLALNVAVSVASIAAGLWILRVGFPAGPIAGAIVAGGALYFVALASVWPLVGKRG